MVDYNTIYNDVKNTLSEKRFRHSEGVVKRAIQYAKIYNVDIDVVKCAAIAHDIAKELSHEEMDEYIKNHNMNLDELELKSRNLLHAKIGADICRNKYGFSDDMANSVSFHTTGRAGMSILEKIIYLADATEEGRGYFDIEYYVNLIEHDINQGMFQVSRWVIGSLIEKGKCIHPNSIECYNYYNEKLNS